MTNVIPARATETTLNNIKVACFKCGLMLPYREAMVDLDGPAFQAYYHFACRPICNDEGCSICHPEP
jgi:hypothetical protein